MYSNSTNKDVTTKREWKCRNGPKEKQFQICDPIYNSIPIFHPINLIIDTPEFKRLRRILQLGTVFEVYPSANHTRYTHSLGVYNLARQMITRLAENNPELGITSRDRLCVCIAALIHDLGLSLCSGHGPFSHMYEARFLKAKGIHFEHEQMSCELFDFMLNNNNSLKRELDEYLNPEDYIFIKELIKPTKNFSKNAAWSLKGRPVEKSFLYEIVSNPITGLDVDKIDYLLRDSHFSKIAITLNTASWFRILDNVEVTMHNGYRTLVYPEKIALMEVFESRKKLHEKVYRHKTVVASESKYIEAFLQADPYLEFLGENGQKFRMSNAHESPQVFMHLDDTIVQMITRADDPRLDRAKSILNAIECRKLPKRIGKLPLNSDAITDVRSTEKKIEADLKRKISDGSVEMSVKIQIFDYGHGAEHSPLRTIIQFENKNPKKILEKSLDHSSDIVAYCYIPYHQIDKKELAKEAVEMLKRDNPKYLYNEGENRRQKRIHPRNEEDDNEQGDNANKKLKKD